MRDAFMVGMGAGMIAALVMWSAGLVVRFLERGDRQ